MSDMKIVQSDKRGQIVIPKKIRDELKIEDGTPFWIYNEKNSIVLEKIKEPKRKKSK